MSLRKEEGWILRAFGDARVRQPSLEVRAETMLLFRVEVVCMELRTPSITERRPARVEDPRRRIRAIAPAQVFAGWLIAVFFVVFAALIDTFST